MIIDIFKTIKLRKQIKVLKEFLDENESSIELFSTTRRMTMDEVKALKFLVDEIQNTLDN